MKKLAIAFCFMPWAVFALFALYVHYSSIMTVQVATAVFGSEWIMLSPLFSALAIIVAYRQGEVDTEKRNGTV